MHLKILMPSMIFLNVDKVKKLVVPTAAGFVGVLPNRLDFVSAIMPGILVWQDNDGQEIFTAVDSGVMLKAGDEVLCSVHNAMTGSDPAKLRQLIDDQFLKLSSEQLAIRTTLSKMESGLLQKLGRYFRE